MQDQVDAFLDQCAPTMPIVLVGHSLGGALAIAGASVLPTQQRNVAAVITFGAPLVGNRQFSDLYKQSELNDITVRVEADGDSIPRIMRRFYYKVHVGLRTWIESFAATEQLITADKRFLTVGNCWLFPSCLPYRVRKSRTRSNRS